MNGGMTEDDWVPGKYGSALEFDGNDSITVPYSSLLDFTNTNNFTIETWFKVKRLPSGGNVMGLVGKFFKYGLDIYYPSVTNTTFILRAGTRGGTQNQISKSGLEFNKFYHAAFVYKANDIMELYLNGVLVGTKDNSTDGDFSANLPLYIAGSDACVGGTCRDLIGVVDDVKIYNYARTPRQILEDMQALLHIGVLMRGGEQQHMIGECWQSLVHLTMAHSRICLFQVLLLLGQNLARLEALLNLMEIMTI